MRLALEAFRQQHQIGSCTSVTITPSVRHVAREGVTDAFIKALPRDKDWERHFPSPGLHDALTAIADGSDQDAASQKVAKDNPWGPFLPTATELSKRLRQLPRVSRVIFAGSIAKDTAALPYSQTDLDIVVIFDGYCPAQHDTLLDSIFIALNTGGDLKGALSEALKGAISKRSFYFSGSRTHEALVVPNNSVTRSGTRTASTSSIGYAQVSYTCHSEPKEEGSVSKEARYIHIEPTDGIAPAVDILVGGEMQQADLTDHFRRQQPSNWVFWSPSSAQRAVALMRAQPPFVRAAARAVKSWRNALELTKSKFRPSSYLIELLCCWAHTSSGIASKSASAIFWEVIKMLAAPAQQLCIKWDKNVRAYSLECVPHPVLASRPLVLDPFNPGNNVVRKENLKKVRGYAMRALKQKPASASKSKTSNRPMNMIMKAIGKLDLVAVVEDSDNGGSDEACTDEASNEASDGESDEDSDFSDYDFW